MSDFDLVGFAAHLGKLVVAEEHETQRLLRHAATIVYHEVIRELGTYQGAAGPFGAWPQLSQWTIHDRIRHGYTPNDPGVASGAMRASVEHSVHGREAHIGSNDQHAVWFELGHGGKHPQPARHVFGGSAFRMAPQVRDYIGIGFYGYLGGATVGQMAAIGIGTRT